MNQERTIIRTSPWLILFVIAGGIGFIAVSIYLGTPALKAEYIQIVPFMFSSFFGLMGILSLISIFTVRIYELTKSELVIKNVVGSILKQISFNEIKGWSTPTTAFEQLKGVELVLHTTSGFVKISTGGKIEFFKTKLAELVQHLSPLDEMSIEKPKTSKDQLTRAKFILISGCVMCVLSAVIWNSEIRTFKEADFSIIESQINNIPDILESSNKKSTNLKLSNYPDFNFNISGIRHDAFALNDFLTTLDAEKKYKIKVLNETFTKKIEQSEKLDYLDKSVNYGIIEVYGMSDSYNDFLPISELNKQSAIDNFIGRWGFLIVGVIFILIGGTMWIVKMLTGAKPNRLT